VRLWLRHLNLGLMAGNGFRSSRSVDDDLVVVIVYQQAGAEHERAALCEAKQLGSRSNVKSAASVASGVLCADTPIVRTSLSMAAPIIGRPRCLETVPRNVRCGQAGAPPATRPRPCGARPSPESWSAVPGGRAEARPFRLRAPRWCAIQPRRGRRRRVFSGSPV
jgi:hypothetical protein